jgi:hypothetical protein
MLPIQRLQLTIVRFELPLKAKALAAIGQATHRGRPRLMQVFQRGFCGEQSRTGLRFSNYF